MRRATGALKSRLSKRKLQSEPGAKEVSRCPQLEQDFLVCDGLREFCQGFSKSIEQLLPLLQEFWQIVQSLDQQWFQEDNGLLDTHIWALRMGLTSTAPKVHQQLQMSLKSISRVAGKFRELEEALQVRNAAWVEKEHYQRKLHEMREELSRQDQSGRSISREQLETLRRNEEKHQRAQDNYESFQEQARAAAEARSELKSALRDAVRTVTCGWFISTGAGVCSAVTRAEQMAAAKAGAKPQAASSGPAALPSSAPPAQAQEAKGGAAAAPGQEEECAEEFDPTNPFKAEWTCEELCSEGATSEATETVDSPEGMADRAGQATRSPSESPATASSSCQPAAGGTQDPGTASGSPLDAISLDELLEMLDAAGLQRPDVRCLTREAARREVVSLLLRSQSACGFASPS